MREDKIRIGIYFVTSSLGTVLTNPENTIRLNLFNNSLLLILLVASVINL